MALLARISGLLEPLRNFSRRKPVWGTCAGAILLSNGGVVGAKKGGQEVIGGFDVRVERNGWGSQVRKSIVIFSANYNHASHTHAFHRKSLHIGGAVA
jgi:glutamine amidotransferase PdxT